MPRYSDIDFNFSLNPISDDVGKKNDNNAIKQSIRNLILMRRYDNPFHPDISSQVPEQLFSNITSATSAMLQRAITYTLENFEPRIIVESVSVDTNTGNENTIVVIIEYTIIATNQSQQYSFEITKLR